MPLRKKFGTSKATKISPDVHQPPKGNQPTSYIPAIYPGHLVLRPSAQTSAVNIVGVPIATGWGGGLTPQVPAGWTAKWDSTYREWYYVNIYSGHSQWTKPAIPVFPSDQGLNTSPKSQPKPQLPMGWTAEWHPGYKEWFYVNIHTKQSQWEKPSRAVQAPSERPNHNKHHNNSQGISVVPTPWYVNSPGVFSRDNSEYLCVTCRHINLPYLFHQSKPGRTTSPSDYIQLGPFREMAEERNCGLCRLVTATVRERIKLSSRHEGERLDTDVERLLTAKWYLSPFVHEGKDQPTTFNLLLHHSVFEEKPNESTPFVIRLITNQERGGRLIPTDYLDFSWIRTTIELCDLNTAIPPKDFDYPILAVDAEQMCIVELDKTTEERYVALSYPWGNVQQLTLSRDRFAGFQRPDSLAEIYDRLARTIQDAITLVSKVGLRYLWVDSLCIVQDDEIEKKNHISQMEKIYRHAYFTIFAISGQDSNHGLPGVRKNSRALTQVTEHVSGLTVANCLPHLSGCSDKLGAWGSRAWTFQERFFSQRALFVGSDGMSINCAHVTTPEDEHCSHSLVRDEYALARNNYHFFRGLDERCEPFLGFHRRTTFDSFAIFIYDYSARKLTYELDALRAFSGVLRDEAAAFGSKMLYGIPEAEFDAGLLWTPIGPSGRRTEFPSWSWVGWTGTAAYPWTHERDTFMSIENSPLVWLDAEAANINQAPLNRKRAIWYNPSAAVVSHAYGIDETDAAWFTSDDLCLPKATVRTGLLRAVRKATDDHLGVRSYCRRRQATWRTQEKYQLFWPNDTATKKLYTLPEGHSGNRTLTFRTLTSDFDVRGEPFERTKLYNVKESIWRMMVYDQGGTAAGYIDIPDPCGSTMWKSYLGEQHFAVLSRSTIDGTFEPPPDSLENRRKEPIHKMLIRPSFGDTPDFSRKSDINQIGWFDESVYEKSRPWCMFNVLMLSYNKGIAYRSAIGRIHVDAFPYQEQPQYEVIEME